MSRLCIQKHLENTFRTLHTQPVFIMKIFRKEFNLLVITMGYWRTFWGPFIKSVTLKRVKSIINFFSLYSLCFFSPASLKCLNLLHPPLKCLNIHCCKATEAIRMGVEDLELHLLLFYFVWMNKYSYDVGTTFFSPNIIWTWIVFTDI